MTFEQAVEKILVLEGGEVNHPDDPGGRTKFGIAAKFYPYLDFDYLSKDGAKAIYYADYWKKIGIEDLPPTLRLAVFDCAVNQGPGTAVKLLQRTCGLKEDGILGPKTLACAWVKPQLTLIAYLALRMERYRMNSHYSIFGKGWESRVAQVRTWSDPQA